MTLYEWGILVFCGAMFVFLVYVVVMKWGGDE